jgi:plasmid maintenance system antidote protein VapI
LKIAIIKSGRSQESLASTLRMSPFRLSRIVRGRQDPTPDEEDRLAELLRAPRHLLFR